MFRTASRTRFDRILAAIEIPAIGLWLGALCGFAFIFAPAAFALLPDGTQFANLTVANLRVLAAVGAVLGCIAFVAALVRSWDAADRTNDILRAVLIVAALGLVAYETFVIVPAMTAIPNVHSQEFAELHQHSTAVYGGVVVLTFVALIMAAVRTDA